MALKGITLVDVDCPVYSMRYVGDRHLLLTGGGGASKTGVANVIEIFELKYQNKTLVAHKVTTHCTESRVVMNCCLLTDNKEFVLAAGMEGYCQLFTLRYKVITPRIENEVEEGIRKRKGNLTMSADHMTAVKMIGFEVEPGDEVLTDTSHDGGYQKSVIFTRDRRLLTAGADGYVRMWQCPSLRKVYEVKVHQDEVDQIDISPDNSKIVTVSRDSHAYLWNVDSGSLITELRHKLTGSYRFRNCRFGVVIDKGDLYNLYTTLIPTSRSVSQCYLIKWDMLKNLASKVVTTGDEILSALSVSDNGIYIGVGTISGSVDVYISFSLQRLYHKPSVHQQFVTALEFAPSTDACRAVTGDFDFTLFSTSVDKQVKVHQQDVRRTYSAIWVIIGFVLIVFLLFWLLASLGV